MALLKAFVCQVILLGLYKLFLEQVVEDHLVPDELTRNCLVGFVCLLCFGIQLYTDKTEDEDNAEADENPAAKTETREKSEKKFEPAEISGIHETVGSNSSSLVTAPEPQTTCQEIVTEKKMSPNNKAGDWIEKSNAVPSSEPEKITDACHLGIFAKFSPNMPNTIPNVIKVNGMREPEMPASTTQASYAQEMTTFPVLNGFSEANICEESDEDSIEIDQFVAKESGKETEQFRTVKTEEIEPIKVEDVLEDTKLLIAEELEGIKPINVTEAKQLRTFEDEVEAIKPEDVESECLTANENISSMQDSNKTTTPEVGESLEAEITNGKAEDSLENGEPSEAEITNGTVEESPETGEPSAITNGTVEESLETGEPSEAEITNGTVEESPETGEPSEAEITNDTVEKSLNIIDSVPSNIIEETESKKLVKDGSEIVQELSSKPDDHTEDIIETLPSAQEMSSSTSLIPTKVMNDVDIMNKSNVETLTKVKNDVDTMNKNNVETSTLVETAVSSPSEKLMVSTPIQKFTAVENVCVAPITIDISFIYACH